MEDVTLLSGERIDEVNEKIRLIQKKNGLTFGTDAFLLASYIKEQKYARAAELGAGTGIISLLLSARERLAAIYAFEIQPEFAELTERNTRLNGLSDKIKTVLKDIRLLTPADTEGGLDVVFTNPPYMKTDSGKRNESDYKYIARHEVCGDINDFCAAGFRLLKHGGRFYAVWRPDRLTDIIVAMRNNRLEPKVITFVHADSESAPSIVLISATKGGAPGVTLTPPLMLYNGKRRDEMSDRAKAKTNSSALILRIFSFTLSINSLG
jgi:tRNA1Val (adenine37-N6)-methyltransferase